MLRVGIGLVILALAQGFNARAASELEFPTLAVGGKVYTNVVVTPTTKNRVLLQHSVGISTVEVSDLTPAVRQELLAAGVIGNIGNPNAGNAGLAVKESSQAGPTDGSAPAPGPGDPGSAQATTVERSTNGSFASLLNSRFQTEARSRGASTPAKVVSMIGLGLIVAILGLGVVFYFVRGWCLFRICRKATGEGSILVFLPFLKWLPLADAARMSRAWLWIPTFGTIGLYLPPPLPGHAPVMAYWILVASLWAVTGVVYIVGCFKICKNLETNLVFGFLLVLPLLDWIALLYLAFSSEKSEAKAPVKGNIVFAV